MVVNIYLLNTVLVYIIRNFRIACSSENKGTDQTVNTLEDQVNIFVEMNGDTCTFT